MEEQERGTDSLTLMLRVGHAIHSQTDKERLLKEAISAIVEALKAHGGSIMLLDDEAKELTIAAAKTLDSEIVKNVRQRVGEGIAGWVAKTGQPLHLKGPIQNAPYQGVNPVITDALSVPIKAKDRIIGVLNVRNVGAERREAFSESDLEMLRIIAGELAIVIDHADLLREAEGQARQSLALYELARATTRALQPEEALNIILEMIGTQMDTRQLLMVELDEETQRLHYRGSRGLAPPVTPGDPVTNKAEQDLLMRAMQRGTPEILSASEIELQLRAGKPWWVGENSESFLISGMSAGGRTLGALVAARPKGYPFSKGDAEFLAALCNQAALALENAIICSRLEEAAVSQERNRIAQEIHDGLSQSLTGLVLELEGARRLFQNNPALADSHMERATNSARNLLADVRDYMKALRSTPPTDQLPVPLIKRALDDFRKTTAIQTKLNVLGAERSVPSEVARALLRITQESLTNVRRHARASEVTVTLTSLEDGVELQVADNGVGFEAAGVLDKAYVQGRFGILGMRERCEGLSGTFNLESAPGRGTKVSVWLPTTAACPPPARMGEQPARHGNS